jgi:hypothetical protein
VAWDWVGEGSASSSIAISKEGGEEGVESRAGGRWQEWISRIKLLVVSTSSTCKSVTGEGSGFRGANSTGGKPGVSVQDSTNSGEMCEDPAPWEGGRVERGECDRGGVAKAGGHNASKFHCCTLAAFPIFRSGGEGEVERRKGYQGWPACARNHGLALLPSQWQRRIQTCKAQAHHHSKP